ncbi:MAG: hypothetical protein SFW67_03280 [Myxococcaceae bacterium]|nr:hypothetical protein [Myxococcaceae bacterium]
MLGWLVVAVLSATPAERLARAQVAYDELQFDQVLALTPAPSEWQQFSRAQVVQALSLRALALASVKRFDEAAPLFRKVFSLEPGFVLPDQFGPKVRTLVAEAKDAAARAGTPGLSMEGGALSVTGLGTGLVESVKLSWRADGVGGTTTVPAAATLEPPWPSSGRIEAWGVVLGPGQSVVATWGSAETPNLLGAAAVASTGTSGSAPTSANGPGALGVTGLVLGGAGLVAVGVGAALLADANRPAQVLAGATRDAEGRITSLTQRDAFALDAAAQRSFETGGVLLAVGGVAAAAGASLFIIDRVRVSAGPTGTSLTVPLDAHFGFAEVSR